ncbi:hypothetical protein LMG16407_03598 [Pandoraea apista]|nr:hypothetical protein LMG16407_03598 [Pandoraea apista]
MVPARGGGLACRRARRGEPSFPIEGESGCLGAILGNTSARGLRHATRGVCLRIG